MVDPPAENNKLWPRGFTQKRLEKVKEAVFACPDLWDDLLQRHNGINEMPEQMKKFWDNDKYGHAMGNFVGNVKRKMVELGVVKA